MWQLFEVKNIIFIISLLFSTQLYAYQINNLKVLRYGGQYKVVFDAQVNAPIDKVVAILTDFEASSDLSSMLKKTEVHRYNLKTARVMSTLRPCVIIFCKTLSKLSIVKIQDGQINFNGVEGAGSFISINETLKYTKSGYTTYLSYKAQLSPKFFVPRWLGVRLIRSSMHKYLGEMIKNIEYKANARR